MAAAHSEAEFLLLARETEGQGHQTDWMMTGCTANLISNFIRGKRPQVQWRKKVSNWAQRWLWASGPKKQSPYRYLTQEDIGRQLSIWPKADWRLSQGSESLSSRSTWAIPNPHLGSPERPVHSGPELAVQLSLCVVKWGAFGVDLEPKLWDDSILSQRDHKATHQP